MAKVKQETLLKKTIENNRLPASKRKSAYQLIKDSGYGEGAATHPGVLFNRKSWKDLMDELVPEQEVLLALQKSISSPFGHVRNQAIDIAIRIRGKYQKEKENEEEKLEDLSELEKENKQLRDALSRKRHQIVKN